ncbi:MAG TPA: hypothetical protein VGN16_03840 [Acidobacteriaceae bacterium]|jgi:hypothetical protein
MSWFSRGPKTPRVNPEVEAKCNIFLLQREVERPDEDDVRAAAQRAWNCRFAGGTVAPDWFVVGNPSSGLSIVACGAYRVQVSHEQHPEWDDDEASDVLPHVRDRAAWGPYTGRIGIDFAFSLHPPTTPVRQAYVARMALEWLSPNIVGIYHSFPGRYLPMSDDAVQELREMAANCPDANSGIPL